MLRRVFTPQFAMLASFGTVSVANYAFGIIAGWLLLPSDFGLLAFAQTVLLIAGLVLNSGFAIALTAALLPATPTRAAALTRGALHANVLLALIIAAALAGLFALGPLRPGFETPQIVGAVVLALPLLAFVAIARAAAQGRNQFVPMAAIQVTEVVGKLVAGVVLMRAGLGVLGGVLGFAIGGLLASAIGAWVLRVRLGIHLWGRRERPAGRVTRDMFGALLGLALLINLDLLALKLLAGADRAVIGQYQVALVLSNAPYYLASALLPLLFNRIAQQGNLAESVPLLGRAVRWVLVGLVPIELALALAPELALGSLFPAAYAAGAGALRVLALGNCALILVAVFAAVLQAAGRARVVAQALLAVTTCEIVVLWLVVPRYGALGAAAVFGGTALVALLVLGASYAAMLSEARGLVFLAPSRQE